MFVSFHLLSANGTPKKKRRNKQTTDSEFSGEDNSDFESRTAVRERARRAAATRIKFDFSDEDGASSSEDEPQLFENKAAVEDDRVKPQVMELSSDDEVAKPSKSFESSEDLFDSLLGKLIGNYAEVSSTISFIASDKKTSSVPVKQTEVVPSKRKRGPLNSDSDSDDAFVPKKTTKKAASSNKSSDSEGKKKKQSKPRKVETDDSDDEVKKKKKKTKKKDSDDEDFSLKKAKGGRKQKKESSDSSSDDYKPKNERVARVGRATKKPANYVFDESDD